MVRALERAAGGEFAALFVAGESGVGKSRLLGELTSTAESRGARVLGGDCVNYSEGEFPYAPVRSALRGLVRELDPEMLDELLGPGRDELARLLPELGAPGPAAPAEWVTSEPVAQAALFERVAGVLVRLAEDALSGHAEGPRAAVGDTTHASQTQRTTSSTRVSPPPARDLPAGSDTTGPSTPSLTLRSHTLWIQAYEA
jgi:hypothetical protein